MPKKSASARKPTPKSRAAVLPAVDQDSEDEFAGRDVVALDAASSSDSDEPDVGVFDIGGAAADSDSDGSFPAANAGDSDDDSDDDSDSDSAPAHQGRGKQQGKGKGKAAVSESEEEEDSDDSEAQAEVEAKMGWGTRRGTFYNADMSTHQLNEQDALDEEAEAIRLQRKAAAALGDDDFAVGTLTPSARPAKLAAGSAAKAVAVAVAGKVGGAGAASVRGDVERVERSTAQLSKDEMLKMIASESPELLSLLKELQDKVVELRERVEPVLTRVRGGDLPTSAGLSFLTVKANVLLSYVTNLVFYLLLKAEGASVRDHPVMDQLHHIRTILERIRPVDAKLRTQINRLVKSASVGGRDGAEEEEGAGAGAGAGTHKPRPGALVARGGSAAKPSKQDFGISDVSGMDSDDVDDEGVYRPLKRSAVLFDDGKPSSRAAREESRAKARASKSRMFRDLLEAYTDAPEVQGLGGAGRGEAEDIDDKLAATQGHRAQFEEEHFVRLTVPRAEKGLLKKRERERVRVDPLRDLTAGFAEIERLAGTRMGAQEPDEHEQEGEAFYAAARDRSAAKSRAKSEAKEERVRAEREAAAGAESEGEEAGERRASKDMMKNRGLTKYRNKERKNPRKNQRIKYESAVKRRSGQVVTVRTGEAGRYAGEATGIRTTVSRSHKIA